MTTRHRLDVALDVHPDAPGTVHVVPTHGEEADIDVVRVGPIGARVDAVRVTHAQPRPLDVEAERLASRFRPLGEALEVVEVDPRLGGAVLRTRPADVHKRQFTEVELTPHQTTVRRHVVAEDGTRDPTPFDVTREHLADLIDDLAAQGQR